MKKGIALPVTYLVILIITILLLGLAIYFLGTIWEWFGVAEEEIGRRTAEQIEFMIKSENAIVAIPFAVKELNLGQKATYGIGIKNIDVDSPYAFKVNFQGAYSPNGREILTADQAYMNENWARRAQESVAITIPTNEHIIYPFSITADYKTSEQHSTESGDYDFTVCVYNPDKGKPSCELDSMSTEYNLLYPPGKMYTVTLRID
jgi:hypothetical protein